MVIISDMPCRCELKKKIKAAAVPWIPERTVYMDYNATTPVDPRVLGSFERACRRTWGNPSSIHSAGVEAWKEMEMLSETAEGWTGRSIDGFYCCAGGTDALNTLILGSAVHSPDAVFMTETTCHSSVKHPLFHLKKKSPAAPSGFGGSVIELEVDSSGTVNLEQLTHKLGTQLKHGRKSILIISPVNHETGAIQPIKEIHRITSESGAVLILDAVQAAARLLPSEWAPYCDAFCLSGHKLYAPKGIGLVWKRPGLKISGLRYGGSAGNSPFPGTENVPGAAALSDSIRLMKKNFNEESMVMTSLIKDGLRILEQKGVEFIVESPENRAPGVCCISLKQQTDMEKLILDLNSRGICISRFSACTGRLDGESAVLKNMGRSGKRASQSLRISLGRWSKREDFFRLAEALLESS